MPTNKQQPATPDTPLLDRVVAILERARANVVRSVNSQMVIAYWLVGREIVEEQQDGEVRAEYGKRVIEDLSRRLTERYGKGFSVANLWLFRQFYQTFLARKPILDTACREFENRQIPDTMGRESEKDTQHVKNLEQGFHPDLGWSHYRALMRVENENARAFYEVEAARNGWSVRQLERQIHSFYYERLLKSRDKAGMKELANQGEAAEQPVDVIKDPYVLEFLDLPESPRLVESELESALISRLQEFLLELGAGFAFIGRQNGCVCCKETNCVLSSHLFPSVFPRIVTFRYSRLLKQLCPNIS